MRKFRVFVILLLVVVLTSCSSDANVNNFSTRKDSYLINESKTVIVEYKTDEKGLLVELVMDRLLAIEDMIYYNTQIDYNVSVEEFTGDVFVDAGFLCTDYDDLKVPVNIEIGNVRFKYDYVGCEYVEVDRDNDEKLGNFVKSYSLDETIDVSRDTIISIVYFDEDSIERFIELQVIPHTVKMLGVYSIALNIDRDDYQSTSINEDGSVRSYYRDMGIYEQLLLKHQENEAAMAEAQGISESINLLDFNNLGEVTPLIGEFMIRYSDEISAFDEVVELIGIVTDETVDPVEE